MAYDIYGQNLRGGHCEVHPHVHESYPCSECYAESRNDTSDRYASKQQEREYYAAMQKHYEDEWMKDNSIVYKCLLKLQSLLNKIIETKRKSLSKRCPI